MIFEMFQKVEFEDVDLYGIIHHPKILYYCERVRTSFFEEKGIILSHLPYGFIITRILIEYKAPLKMHDRIRICQIVHRVRDYKFVLKYRLIKDDTLMVEAVMDFVMIDLMTKNVMALSENVSMILNSCRELQQ